MCFSRSDLTGLLDDDKFIYCLGKDLAWLAGEKNAGVEAKDSISFTQTI
jgi:hypothetical protein